MKKVYVLDTNVLLSDPNAIFSFGKNDIVIPSVVLQEIDNKKKLMDEIGRNARYFAKQIDKLRENGKLHKGIKLDTGGTLRIVAPPQDSKAYDNFLDNTVDTRIVATAKTLMEVSNNNVIVVSKDALVRVKSDAEGVIAEDYLHDKVISSEDDKYRGYVNFETDAKTISEFKKGKMFDYDCSNLNPNQFVVMNNGNQKEFAINKDNSLCKTYKYSNGEFVFGLQAKNLEQRMALEVLLDDEIPLVTLSGKAGTGKTLLALAVGLQRSLEDRKYNKVLVARPIVAMGKDIGYLPGEKEEKLRPWMQPIYDNLEFLFDAKDERELQSKLQGYEDIIQVEALTYIRGRSIPKQYLIIDEAQNLTQHEVKTILTRVGEGSKIILVGDPEQIDHPYLDAYSNGLTYVIEKMKHLKESAHITLSKGERSDLAQLCADIL